MEPVIYLRALHRQFTLLWAFATRINEVDTAAAISGEFRGMQDAGWSTVHTSREVFGELKVLGNKGAPLTKPELRQVLCLYSQLAEAGGVYESLLNTMQVVQLKAYNLWPFQDLVRVRHQPRAVIGPNANAMFRRLAQVAHAIGMPHLSRLLEITFRDDIRNAMAHADYILGPDGLRLRRRNGGNPVVVSHQQMLNALQIALFFFELQERFRNDVAQGFRPARTIIGRFSDNYPMPWTIELADDGSFSIAGEAPGPQVDAAFERQQRINNRLGGRVVAAYLAPEAALSPDLLAAITAAGLEPLVVAMDTAEAYNALLAEVEAQGLWDPAPNLDGAAVLMITPFGFRWIATGAEFDDWLPPVEEIEVA
jgi:hypothetical protein